MIYVTGDTHGEDYLWSYYFEKLLKEGDTLIIAGDFGFIFSPERNREFFFDCIAEKKYTVLFIDGNHENLDLLYEYPVQEWNGGKVHCIRHNLLHLMRGEIYNIEGKKLFAMGGGYSLDKDWREPGESWWPQEMPSDKEYRNAQENLKKADYKVDYIITHTAPQTSIATLVLRGFCIKGNVLEEQPLTGFLEWVAEQVSYERWYFGHFHVDFELDTRRQYALLDDVRELQTGSIAMKRI